MISNRSTGKQGYALAAASWARGAQVTLISTAELSAPVGVTVVPVETAAQMQAAVEQVADAEIIVMAAAVADFAPANPALEKIKKASDDVPEIKLVKTHDFLVELGAKKQPHQTIVGFAAETENLLENARGKLDRKHLDLIVANDVSAPRTGFGHDTNDVTLLTADGSTIDVPLGSKRDVSEAILDSVVTLR